MNIVIKTVVAAMGFVFATSLSALTFDFEDGSPQGWRVLSGSFGTVVSDRANFHNRKTVPFNKEGKYFLSTLETPQGSPSDRYHGIIQSPPMILKGATIRFLIAGGKTSDVSFTLHDAQGTLHATAAGENDETMREVVWQVPQLIGQTVFMRVTDASVSGWGFLTLDHIRLDAEIPSGEHPDYWKRWTPHETYHTVDTHSLGRMIDDLAVRYGNAFDPAPYRAALDNVSDAAALDSIAIALARLHPALKQPLLFTTRHQYRKDHHNTATMFQTNEINWKSYRAGGPMKKIDLATGEVSIVYDPGAAGAARDPELSFDGKKILFSARKNKNDDYHIYEIGTDGTHLRQLTELPGVSDIDPIYLPDGDIIFSSTRQPKFCMCNRHIMANIFRMGADGANPHPIGRSTLFEGHAVLLPDGRILYDRWEYVDRNFGDAQGLWTVNPDGTNHAIYWGNNTQSPGGVVDARPIPGTQKVIAVLASCHDRPWGALGIIDRQKGLDGPEPVEHTWPASFRKEIMVKGKRWYDSPMQTVKKRYEDPYPLDDGYFLAVRALDPARHGEKTGIFLLDLNGNEILIHAEAGDMGCYDPMPIAPRMRPPVRPVTTDLTKQTGVFFLQNVYEGTHMQGVAPGEVKYLRIVESPEKRTWTKHGWNGQGEQAPGVNWHSFETKRVLGIVPVESDGSASFEVPADCFVYFQALDSQKRMIQSMRSGTIVRPGEYMGCVGCHEDRLTAPPVHMGQTLATRRAPSKMDPAPQMFSYRARVQPIFDAHCTACHDFGKDAGRKLNLADDLIMPFNTSYTELWAKRYISCIGGGPAELQPAKSWGAARSKLIRKIDGGHLDQNLTEPEMDTLCEWIDINGVYYPYYETAYPNGVFGQGPLTPGEFNALREYFKNLPTGHGFRGSVTMSLTRPDSSPALTGLSKTDAEAALKILRLGQARLRENPRADMDGFKPSDEKQLLKYDRLAEIEQRIREAMVNGKRLYDKDFRESK